MSKAPHSPPSETPDAGALRAELAAVILALGRAETAAEAADLVRRRNVLGRQLAHLLAEISAKT